jgi:aryl-alcohol dehydrogenase-like predicted oxidoreductase
MGSREPALKLYHYYERDNGPFRSISDLPDREAEAVLHRIRTDHPDIFLAKRPEDYLQKRRRFEGILREEFIRKGGLIERETPHYMVVEACPFFE